MKHLKKITFICMLAFFLTDCSPKKSTTKTESETLKKNSEVLSSKSESDVTPALELFKKILHNETFFFDENNEKVYITHYQQDRSDLNFAIIDMDGNGTPELLLHKLYNGDTIVMHYYNGLVHANEYGFRGMNSLKVDGTFNWSNSAFNSGIGRLQFIEVNQKTIYLVENDTQEENEIFRINNIEVNQEDFWAFTATQDNKAELIWYELTTENIDKRVDALLDI